MGHAEFPFGPNTIFLPKNPAHLAESRGLPAEPFIQAETALQRARRAGLVEDPATSGQTPLERKAVNVLTGTQEMSDPGDKGRQLEIVRRRTRNLRRQIQQETGFRPAVAKQLRRVRNLTAGGSAETTGGFKQAGSKRGLTDAINRLEELNALQDPDVQAELQDVGVEDIQAVLEGPAVGTGPGMVRGGSPEANLQKDKQAQQHGGPAPKSAAETAPGTDTAPTAQDHGGLPRKRIAAGLLLLAGLAILIIGVT